MSEAPIHFCLVSDQALANLLPALDPGLRPARVVFAVSPEMRARALDQQRVLSGYQLDSELLELPSAYDTTAITQAIEAWLATNGDAGSKVWFNATGGTKPMAMAAQTVFQRRGLPVCQGQANFPQCGNSNFPTRLGLLVK